MEQELYAFFEGEDARRRYEASTRNTVRHWRFRYLDLGELETYRAHAIAKLLRDSSRELLKAFEMVGIQSLFAFEAISAKEVVCRKNGCW